MKTKLLIAGLILVSLWNLLQMQVTKPRISDDYLRGKTDGIKWAIGKMIDGKIILAPTNISDGITISNCVIIRVIEPSPCLSFDSTAHAQINGCAFYGEVELWRTLDSSLMRVK